MKGEQDQFVSSVEKMSLVISQGSNTLFIKGCSVLTLSLPCLSVQIQHESLKSMNSVQQQCEHHH